MKFNQKLGYRCDDKQGSSLLSPQQLLLLVVQMTINAFVSAPEEHVTAKTFNVNVFLWEAKHKTVSTICNQTRQIFH